MQYLTTAARALPMLNLNRGQTRGPPGVTPAVPSSGTVVAAALCLPPALAIYLSGEQPCGQIAPYAFLVIFLVIFLLGFWLCWWRK